MDIYIIIAVIFLIAFLIPKNKKENQIKTEEDENKNNRVELAETLKEVEPTITKMTEVSKEEITPLKTSETPPEPDLTISETPVESAEPELNISGAYQKRWMFTYNEKDAYHKLKSIANELGYTVFAKVRLLDLLEPKKGIPKYKTYFYKIQAKHVDFVLCDQKLVARYIIELDDSSHDAQPRKERDEFVDQVLESVGYKTIHTRAITDDIKKQIEPIK